MYVKIRFGGTSTRAYTRIQARSTTPEFQRQRVTDTTSHGLSTDRHSTQTTMGSPDSYYNICRYLSLLYSESHY